MSRGPKKTKVVTVSLNLEALAQLWWVADEDKRSFSWVVREALALGLPELLKKRRIANPPAFSAPGEAEAFLKERDEKDD